jgi:hypothetical protein
MTNKQPTAGLCTLPELLEVLLMYLPAGVALACMETALRFGLVVRNGEVFPWYDEISTPESTSQHFRDWIPRLPIDSATAILRMAGPFAAPGDNGTLVNILCMSSETLMSRARERGWITDAGIAHMRLPEYREYIAEMHLRFVQLPPDGYEGDPIAWSQTRLTVHDTEPSLEWTDERYEGEPDTDS